MFRCSGNNLTIEINADTHPGDIVRLIREHANLTREELEAKSGYSASTIKNWEKKRVSPPYEGVRDVLQAMGFRMEVSNAG